MNIYYVDQIDISHANLVDLRRDGKMLLGVDKDIAVKVSQGGLIPKGSTVGSAFGFWNIVIVVVFFGSVYLSFTWAWWSFIAGWLISTVLYNANKSGNSENILELAMSNPSFYESMRSLNLWQYQMTEETAAPFLRNKSAVS